MPGMKYFKWTQAISCLLSMPSRKMEDMRILHPDCTTCFYQIQYFTINTCFAYR